MSSYMVPCCSWRAHAFAHYWLVMSLQAHHRRISLGCSRQVLYELIWYNDRLLRLCIWPVQLLAPAARSTTMRSALEHPLGL